MAGALALELLILIGSVSVVAQPLEPETVVGAHGGPSGLWQLRSRHLVWGLPRQTDARHNVSYPGESDIRPGLTVLVREGFVLGHYDLYKVPAWVAVRWTREDFDRLGSDRYGRPFARDEELPLYARADTDYDYSSSHMERGHMARHEDNEAWGKDNSDAGCLMSNVVPQHRDMNGEAWNDLEEMHQEAVDDASLGIDTLWVISGPIFEHDAPRSTVGNGVGVPEATYKVVGWFDSAGEFRARGYIVRQEDRVRDNPAYYLRPIDEIERLTGLDFFPELPADRAAAIESVTASDLWGLSGDMPVMAMGNVEIAAFLPNPLGNTDAWEESVTLRNAGTEVVSLVGWVLEDRSGRRWTLTGTIEPGDERTFLRMWQPMALNNDGDTVRLIAPDGTVADLETYGQAAPGEVFRR